jgi:hypothetical protein
LSLSDAAGNFYQFLDSGRDYVEVVFHGQAY